MTAAREAVSRSTRAGPSATDTRPTVSLMAPSEEPEVSDADHRQAEGEDVAHRRGAPHLIVARTGGHTRDAQTLGGDVHDRALGGRARPTPGDQVGLTEEVG